MTTRVVEPGLQLEMEIEQFERDIEATRAEILEWETRERECNSLLTELRAQYVEAAGLKVMGKSAPVDNLASQIETLKEQSIGYSHVIGVKREQLSDLQSRLQPLHEQQAKRVEAHNIAAERTAVEEQIAAATQALDDLENGALRFATGLRAIRERAYLDEKTKAFAFDQAFALQRRSVGQRP
jgi:predicted  nucleic acid-binding Zn-ribbon protein